MYKNTSSPAILLLEDGTIFYGKGAGAIGISGGEICFNTGMTGYQEIFTDPSYFGQLMVMTNVHIGNYGTQVNESESDKIHIAGLVCRNFSSQYNRSLADDSLQQFLSKLNIAAIYDVDTRAIVRHIRSHGAMNALVATDSSDMPTLRAYLSKVPNMNGLELASKVSTNVIYDVGNPNAKIKIAVLDFGIKKSILVQLAKYDYNIRVFPAHTAFVEINNWNPDAYFLSNGPGDPAPMDYAIQTAKLILESKKPVFGICLGHQLLGLAMGISTIKMFHGHRGINHPVKNLQTGLSEITSQNHGFSLDMEQVNKQSATIELTHINLNDHSVEGIRHKTNPVFSVQYHPEAGPGPHDSRYLFRQFSDSIQQSIGTN